MRRIWFVILLTSICFAGMGQETPTRTIFAYGGGFTRQFMSYVITLTKKENPKICFLPTATGDNANTINQWYTACEGLPMRGYVQRAFVASYTDSKVI